MGGRLKCYLILVVVFVAGCAQPPVIEKPDGPPRHKGTIPSERVIPREEPRSKYGNPPSYVVLGRRYHVMASASGYVERGVASWYGSKFHGRRTSSGETYDMYGLTAAHKSLPLPTYVRVTNLQNGRSIIVKVNDRGPFHSNRIIDLSYAAAVKLAIVAKGTGLVEVRAIDARTYTASAGKEDTGLIDVAQTTATEDRQVPVKESVEPLIYLQVGAFRAIENAARLRSQLAAANLGKVTVYTSDLGGAPIHRVRIGPLDTVDTADTTVQRLESLGLQQHNLVIE